jgi:catechol 2,3-dioxygenase-like lactoylglutathione lyase family enzyme
MARVLGLGHLGIYVQDLDRMVAHYRDFLGMTVTKQNWDAGMVFLSAEPQAADHEIALMRGRPSAEDPHLINQISMRVASLTDVKDFYHRIKEQGYRIQRVVSHASAVGCYFYDPEENVNEVFWLTGLPCWVVTSEPIDLDQDDTAILAQVHAHWLRLRNVPVGGTPEATAASPAPA